MIRPAMRLEIRPESLTAEALFIRHIVHEKDAHGAAIVCRCDCTETLLSSRIPLCAVHQH